ncbi:hypothetical protein R1flu_019857 [Riccia fluitans]|uniref:Uncharacterized protein n=1 Tax=Riccia fluitans TaxID=41844 RepID=A0ABD1ZNC4_9MARC
MGSRNGLLSNNQLKFGRAPSLQLSILLSWSIHMEEIPENVSSLAPGSGPLLRPRLLPPSPDPPLHVALPTSPEQLVMVVEQRPQGDLQLLLLAMEEEA